MARANYFVIRHERQWKISFDGEQYGPYTTQKDAIRAAVDAARRAGQIGNDAQVMVQGVNNKFRAAWTHDNAPNPSPG
jgi:hypothetical protein